MPSTKQGVISGMWHSRHQRSAIMRRPRSGSRKALMLPETAPDMHACGTILCGRELQHRTFLTFRSYSVWQTILQVRTPKWSKDWINVPARLSGTMWSRTLVVRPDPVVLSGNLAPNVASKDHRGVLGSDEEDESKHLDLNSSTARKPC